MNAYCRREGPWKIKSAKAGRELPKAEIVTLKRFREMDQSKYRGIENNTIEV
jgi:hypothetical protein